MNRVTLEYGNCVIHEHYATGKGYSGESLNAYDSARRLWHQTWVDNTGLLLASSPHQCRVTGYQRRVSAK